MFHIKIKFLLKVYLFLVIASSTTEVLYAFNPIIIDGTTYTNYALLSHSQTGGNVYTDLNSAVIAAYPTIIVDTGSFMVSGTVKIRQNNLLIIGRSKDVSKIIQTNPNKDLLHMYANGTTVKNVTLDTKTYNAYAAYVIGDGVPTETVDATLVGNNNTLTNCNILGSNKGFTLYVAGPTYKNSIYTKYGANELSNGNNIINNYMEGSYIRDSFVFALQKNGIVQNNTFSGGELDIYMDRSSTIDSNTFLNSNKAGIFISGPSDDLIITNNLIDTTREHGIKSFYQIDNIPIPNGSEYINNVRIEGNTIKNSGENGMDLNYFSGGIIRNNTIQNSSVHGIAFVHKSSYNLVSGNIITDFGIGDRFRGSGLFITDRSVANSFISNTLSFTVNSFAYAGVFVETDDSTLNTLTNNSIIGKFRTAGVASYDPNIILNLNTIINNFGGRSNILIY